MCSRAWPDWAYEFPDQTGPDTQIYWTGPAQPDWIRTYVFKHFTYQERVINSHQIRSMDTNLVSKVNKQKKSWKKSLIFFSIFNTDKSHEGKKSGFRTVRILKIYRTSEPDVMSLSGKALKHWLSSYYTVIQNARSRSQFVFDIWMMETGQLCLFFINNGQFLL